MLSRHLPQIEQPKRLSRPPPYRPLAGDGESGVPGLIKIDSLRLSDLRNADQLAVRPGRQRDPDQWSRQHLSSVMGRGNEMRNRAVRTVIN